MGEAADREKGCGCGRGVGEGAGGEEGSERCEEGVGEPVRVVNWYGRAALLYQL